MSNVRVLIETGYGTAIRQSINATDYLEDCLDHSFSRGEAPWSPGAFYGTYHPDKALAEQAALAWVRSAELLAVYIDTGLTVPMHRLAAAARLANVPVEVRSLNAQFPAAALKQLHAQLTAGGQVEEVENPPEEAAS